MVPPPGSTANRPAFVVRRTPSRGPSAGTASGSKPCARKAACTDERSAVRGATRGKRSSCGTARDKPAAAAGALPTQRHQYQFWLAAPESKKRSLNSRDEASLAVAPHAVEAGCWSEPASEASSRLFNER